LENEILIVYEEKNKILEDFKYSLEFIVKKGKYKIIANMR
jgi:hypothetical protein